MRVLHVIDTLNIGGAERVSIDLCNILIENGIDVSMLTLTNSAPLSKYLNSKIPFQSLTRRWKWSIIKLFSVNAYCRNFDIVHVHLRYNFRYVALSKFIFRGKYKILLHDHFGDIENDKGVPFGIRFFLSNSWFIGVSQPLVDWASNFANARVDRCFLLSNIIVKSPNPEPALRGSDTIKILHISNFRPSKNHKFAFELFNVMRKSLPITVCFVGQVIDINYFKQLQIQIKNLGIDDIVSIMHTCDNPQKIMTQYDLAIHTAHQESGPLVLMEYLAQRIPFVAFKTGEVATQISDQIPELFMTNFEVSDWIDRVKSILAHRLSYLDILDNCFDKLYSNQAYFNSCLSIYKRVYSENE